MDNQSVPAHLVKLVEAGITVAREELVINGNIISTAVMGQNEDEKSFFFTLGQAESSQEAAEVIRLLAARLDADYIFIITEGWMLKGKDCSEETLKRYGSIQNTPNRIECVLFQLETHEGTWSGIAEQKPLNDLQTARTFGEVDMRLTSQPQGNLTNLLLPRHNGESAH